MSDHRKDMDQCNMIRQTMTLEYAAGTLCYEKTLLIEVCASMCPDTRTHIQICEDMGGALIEKDCEPFDMAEDSLDNVMARIERGPKQKEESCEKSACCGSSFEGMNVPQVLIEYMNQQGQQPRWKRFGRDTRMCDIKTPSKRTKMYIIDMKPGAQIPEHTHRGKEYTLVLRGAVMHHDHAFGRGSFLVHDESDTHQPSACPEHGCVCVVLMDQAVRFTHWPFKALNIVMR